MNWPRGCARRRRLRRCDFSVSRPQTRQRLRVGILGGTFDPIHNGHIDIAMRAVRLFDEVIVGVYETPLKSLLLPTETRFALVKEVFRDEPRITVTTYHGLTVNYCREIGAQAVVRGLRVLSDFEYEFQMALVNRKLDSSIETVFFMPREEYSYLTSSLIKDVGRHGGDLNKFLHPDVARRLQERLRSGSS